MDLYVTKEFQVMEIRFPRYLQSVLFFLFMYTLCKCTTSFIGEYLKLFPLWVSQYVLRVNCLKWSFLKLKPKPIQNGNLLFSKIKILSIFFYEVIKFATDEQAFV